MDSIKIGKYIARKRKELGMTQKQLGDILNVNDKTVSRWETGKYMPDLSLLIPLSKALGVTVYSLLNGADMRKRLVEIVASDEVFESFPFLGVFVADVFILYFFKNFSFEDVAYLEV